MNLIAAACFAVTICCAAQHGASVMQKTPTVYELYSWQTSDGGWSFSMLPNTSSETPVRVIFDKKRELRGIDQLKKRISELPAGVSIVWLDRTPTGTKPKAKGSEGLKYPPRQIIDEIRSFGGDHKIDVLADRAP